MPTPERVTIKALGKTYTFRLQARDRAGNVSAQAEVTRLAQEASEHVRLPLIFR